MESQIIPLERIDTSSKDPHRFWKLLLFSDGSMTRNLENLTQSVVRIEIISEKLLENTSELECHYKDYYNSLEKPIIQRKVFLKNEKSETLMSAISLWNSRDYELIMKEKENAIGNNIISAKLEYFREILHVNILKNYQKNELIDLEDNEKKKFISDVKFRSYFIHHNKKILTYIEEIFLSDIEKYLNL